MKKSPIYGHLLEKLIEVYQGSLDPELTDFRIPTTVYTDESRLQAERRLLRTLPMAVAHVSQLQAAGACLVHDALGVPVMVTRNREGGLHAMLNVCRHRGTRLMEDAGFCKVRKGFRCRYHGWTYDIEGNLLTVPKQEMFPSLDKSKHNLISLPVTERFGFVWVVATPGLEYDFDAFLDPLEPDLGPLNLESHVVFPVDFVSRASAYPTALGEVYWEHDLIIPEEPKSEKVRAHWELNYELIQNGVFKGEDLWVCEQIQQGLASGANEFLTYGIEEAPIEWWHEELNRRTKELT